MAGYNLVPIAHDPFAAGGPVQESHATLAAQQSQLLAGDRKVQMFPKGTAELPVSKGMSRIKAPNGDVFHFNPKRIKASAIIKASRSGRENDVLGLGPVSKTESIQRVLAGEHPVAVVERDAHGTEVRGAAGTHVTAPAQMAAMERGKSPGHRVGVEHPGETIARRLAGGGPADEKGDQFADRWGDLPDTLAQRWGDTPDTLNSRWGDMPSNRVRREEANPARAMRQTATTQDFNKHAGEVGQRWLDEYYKVPGDILQGKYTPQPADPGTWSEYDQEARNRGASALQKIAPLMAMEGAGRGVAFAEPGAAGVFGGKLVQPEGIRAYHGSTTLDGPFEAYGKELGPHFGTINQADSRIQYASSLTGKKDTYREGARLVPVDINARKPLEMNDVAYWEPANVLRGLGRVTDAADKRVFTPKDLVPIWSNYRKWKQSASMIDERNPEIRNTMLDQLRDVMQSKGYDSIKYTNQWEGNTSSKNNIAIIPLARGTVKSSLSGDVLYGAPAGGALGYYLTPVDRDPFAEPIKRGELCT